MRIKQPWDRFFKSNEFQDLHDLRGELILEIGAGGIFVGWIIMVSAIGYAGNNLNLIAAMILFLASGLAMWLRKKNFLASLYLLILGMLGAIAAHKLCNPQGGAQFFFPVAVVVSSLLVSNLSVFLIAMLASAVCFTVVRVLDLPLLEPIQFGLPIILIYITAFAAWLSSRQILSVLGWMQSSYSQAREWLEQLRDERMAQARTIKILEEAYARIEKLNYLFAEARLAAEEARRIKAEFAANISHELRTPLNLILGFSETMANAPETYAGARWTPMLRGDIEEIYRSSRHLLSLIDDILDLSALDVHRFGLTMEVADIGRVIEEAAAVVRGLYQAKHLYLKINTQADLPLIRMDVTRIRQVLINLLSNASRFTPTGGVTITTTLVNQDIQVAVTDTGIGIEAKNIPKVFEEFGQVDGSISRPHEGTGLGVPLSKRLVELHGGKMWLQSVSGQGTTFFFTLPWQTETPPMEPAQPLDAALPAPRSIRKSLLIAETDPLLVRSMRRQISDYDLIEVAGPDQIEELLAMHHPAAMVIDTRALPSGTREADWLAAVPRDLPVISAVFEGNLRIAQELNVQGYLLKPVSRDQLLEAIENLPNKVHSILMIDNDPQLLELFGRMLETAGGLYQSTAATSGMEGLRLLHAQPFDLVLLDLFMPDMNGMDVLRSIKQDPELSQVQVIMISGQYPEGLVFNNPLSFNIYRAGRTSLTEIVNCLEVVLPVVSRGSIPSAPNVPASPGGASAPPVSSDTL
jgi:signal transduction histidine kinase/DNA-binding NarL/FixJ family response regulator